MIKSKALEKITVEELVAEITPYGRGTCGGWRECSRSAIRRAAVACRSCFAALSDYGLHTTTAPSSLVLTLVTLTPHSAPPRNASLPP